MICYLIFEPSGVEIGLVSCTKSKDEDAAEPTGLLCRLANRSPARHWWWHRFGLFDQSFLKQENTEHQRRLFDILFLLGNTPLE